MLLGSILLALAWAALQGEITLANLAGRATSSATSSSHCWPEGGVMPSTLTSRTAHAVGLAAFFVWELMLANVRVASTSCARARPSDRRCVGDPARRHQRRRDPVAVDADQHHARQRDHRSVGGPADAATSM